MQKYEDDVIKNEIFQGLLQVDSSFFMTSFDLSIDKQTRKTKIKFEAETDNGENISEVISYA